MWDDFSFLFFCQKCVRSETACSLGLSLPSSPTSAADTSHPADVPRFPFAGSTIATVRRWTPLRSGGSLFCSGLSRATLGPCLVNTTAPGVTQCRWMRTNSQTQRRAGSSLSH